MAEVYMCYQARKHTKTDLLDDILDHIQTNPHTYLHKAIDNERDDNLNTQGDHRVRNSSQGSGQNRGNMF